VEPGSTLRESTSLLRQEITRKAKSRGNFYKRTQNKIQSLTNRGLNVDGTEGKGTTGHRGICINRKGHKKITGHGHILVRGRTGRRATLSHGIPVTAETGRGAAMGREQSVQSTCGFAVDHSCKNDEWVESRFQNRRI